MRILSRSSTLAVVQARLVGDALRARWPDLPIEFLTRSSLGDRSSHIALWDAPDKGLFTADLSDALVSSDADLVVHSWKDLPVEGDVRTVVAGTLPRADVRDVLLLRREAIDRQPGILTLLTSSPRRAWQLRTSLSPLVPWPVTEVLPVPVRGNIPTRLERLVAGDADGLVVAKAALDRLLAPDAPADVRVLVRQHLASCRWMVLPTREFPAAPAQGALAIEVASHRTDLLDLVRAISHEPTFVACQAERALLASYGGGCHEAIGATVLVRDFGTVTSLRGRLPDGNELGRWELDRRDPDPPAAPRARIWPRPGETLTATRTSLDGIAPPSERGWWIARAEALPSSFIPGGSRVVWAAGTRTWRKLAARGVWVNGCADSLGDAEAPGVDLLAGEPIVWRRLTHDGTNDPQAAATYTVRHDLPDDLGARTHFFWTSGRLFLDALRRVPSLASGWHASGPGRTSRVIRDALGPTDRASIWLDYDQWIRHILR